VLQATAGASIWSAPFRPGELPLIAWVPLCRQTRELIGHAATEACLPVELWVRIAVEAARLVAEIADLSGARDEVVVAALDDAAGISEEDAPAQTAASSLRRYAAELSGGRSSAPPGEELALRLPEEMRGAWSRAAIAAGSELPRWIAARLEEAPPGCVGWEARAAAECRSLGEWSYASWLRSSASSRA
jgi:hypothetical protein